MATFLKAVLISETIEKCNAFGQTDFLDRGLKDPVHCGLERTWNTITLHKME